MHRISLQITISVVTNLRWNFKAVYTSCDIISVLLQEYIHMRENVGTLMDTVLLMIPLTSWDLVSHIQLSCKYGKSDVKLLWYRCHNVLEKFPPLLNNYKSLYGVFFLFFFRSKVQFYDRKLNPMLHAELRFNNLF